MSTATNTKNHVSHYIPTTARAQKKRGKNPSHCAKRLELEISQSRDQTPIKHNIDRGRKHTTAISMFLQMASGLINRPLNPILGALWPYSNSNPQRV